MQRCHFAHDCEKSLQTAAEVGPTHSTAPITKVGPQAPYFGAPLAVELSYLESSGTNFNSTITSSSALSSASSGASTESEVAIPTGYPLDRSGKASPLIWQYRHGLSQASDGTHHTRQLVFLRKRRPPAEVTAPRISGKKGH